MTKSIRMESDPTMPPEPKKRPSRRQMSLRRYGQAALRNAVNGAGYAVGAGAVGLLFWWLQR